MPLSNGTEAKFSGICLEETTLKFSTYLLRGQVENDLKHNYNGTKNTKKLLNLPVSVGGAETGFMIGIKYFRYHPSRTWFERNDASISVAGMMWFPLDDLISLDVNTLNFAKNRRGEKPTESENVIPDVITRRHCVSKTAEIFDITGKITPITATMKMEMHELVIRQLDWGDSIPDDLRQILCSHFEMIVEIDNYVAVAQWLKGRRTFFDNCVSQHLSGAGSSPAGSVGRDLNLQKLNYQYLSTSVAVVLVVR